MLFSAPTEYAIRALIYLASPERQAPISVTDIAQNTGIPSMFLAKILITLKKHHLLKSNRGPGGGYRLGKPPDQIRLAHIVRAIEPAIHGPRKCVLGLDICSDEHPCPLHFEWKSFREEFDNKIHQLTIAELHQKLGEKRAHLKG